MYLTAPISDFPHDLDKMKIVCLSFKSFITDNGWILCRCVELASVSATVAAFTSKKKS